MTQSPERMAVTKTSVLEQSELPVELVQFLRNVTATDSRADQLQTAAMHSTVLLPQIQMRIRGMIHEQGSLQGGIIPGI